MANFTDKQLKAIELIAVSELEGYTMEEVAEQAGVASRTIRRWKESKDFTKAVHIRTLEVLAQQSPKALKNTLDFMDSNDVKVRLQGNTFYLKELERLETLKQQEQEASKTVDVEEFFKAVGVETLETAKSKPNHLKKEIREGSDKVKWGTGSIIYHKRILALIEKGMSWKEAKEQVEGVAVEPEEYVQELTAIFGCYGLDIRLKENRKEDDPEGEGSI